MADAGTKQLTTIIKRLEAATSRLEDLAAAQSSNAGPTSTAPPAPPPPPPAPSAAAAQRPAMTEVPRNVAVFDETVIDAKLKPFVELTKSFAAKVVVDQVLLVESAFKTVRSIILTASACSKPDATGLNGTIKPLGDVVSTIVQFEDKNRKEREWFLHIQTIAGGISAVGWVAEAKPVPAIDNAIDSAAFYANKIMAEHKEKNQKQVDWARAWRGLLQQMKSYVQEYHTAGLSWNPKGVPVSQFSATASSSSSSGPPPPPPPPPATSTASTASSGTVGAAAVFAELNRGEAVTKGLRKVDRSEMTHKNPELRASSVVPPPAASLSPKRPTKPSKPASLQGKKPSKLALEDNKWFVEYYENESALVIDKVEIGHVVYIFGCKSTTIQVTGKVNAISLVNCVKTSVLADSVISSISVTNSPSFALQITGSAPTIQVDSTDSGQIYLSKHCLDTEITTAKCSSINVSLPVEGEEDGVFVERAVPEMLRTTVKGGKLVTNIVEHSG